MRAFLLAMSWIPVAIHAWTTLPEHPLATASFLGNGSELIAFTQDGWLSDNGKPDLRWSTCRRRTASGAWEAVRCVESLRGNLGVVEEPVPDSATLILGRKRIHVERLGSGVRQWISSLPEASKLLDQDEDRLLVAGGNQYLFVIRIPRELPADPSVALEQIQVRLRLGPNTTERSEWSDVVGGRLSGARMLIWTRNANWTSRDSGYTWVRTPLPPFREAAMVGDTIVAITATGGTFHRSRDGGATWDTGATVKVGSPTGLRFLDHRLFGQFSSDGIPEMARSDDLGNLWSTVLEGGAVSRMAYWQGEIWACGAQGTVRSRDGGRSWIPFEAGLPFKGAAWKVRAWDSGLLVGRELSASGRPGRGSLWTFQQGWWTRVRDDVTNFERDAPELGGRIHAIVADESGADRLVSSADLVEWTPSTVVRPWSSQMETDGGLVVVGSQLGASRSTSGGQWEGLPSWSSTGDSPNPSGPFRVWRGRVVWRERSASNEGHIWMEGSNNGPEPLLPEEMAVNQLVPLDDSLLVAEVAGVVGLLHSGDSMRFEPVLEQGRWSLDAHRGVVLAHLPHGSRFHRITRDSVLTFTGPVGVRITSVWHLPARSFDPLAEVSDSGYLVEDSSRSLHWSGPIASTAIGRPKGREASRITVREDALHLEMGAEADVVVEIFDPRGRRAGPTRILRLPAGSHRISLESGKARRFVRVRIGDQPPRTLRLPIFP